jgi:DNA-binding PadR family transcriptional regulator
MRVTMPSGEKVRMGRASRRVLLTLLSGATNLSGFPIGRAAQVGYGHVYIVLARLEHEEWVTSDWGEPNKYGDRRRFYRLTPYGRVRALKVLGLDG